MKKILAIGNSFSQDATALLEFFAPDLYVRNLYIPGCPLSYHSELIKTGEPLYEYQVCGEADSVRRVSLAEGLDSENWDYVTLQQVSGLSGIEESFYPHLTSVLNFVRRRTSAKIVLHETWAYETGSEHPDFSRYDNDRKKMQESIRKTYDAISAKEGLPVIRTGELIAKLRENPFFDVGRGGISLCRDGFHLSLNFGRIAAAGIWTKFFTGKLPQYLMRKDLSEGSRIISESLKD